MVRNLDPTPPPFDRGSSPQPPSANGAEVGRLLGGRYELVRKIASGGMAEVHEARDTVLGRRVAIKILHASYSSDPEFVERFRKEATSAGQLNHPNIVQVYDWGQDEGRSFMVMELIEGQTLRDVLNDRGPLTPVSAARIAEQVCAGLDAARRESIVHRDIKPENILITNDARVKVADFGVARALAESRATQAGLVIGTASYLAPEQVEGSAGDHRSDLYSLGTCIFEMVEGHPPFRGDNPVVVAYRRVKEDVPRLGSLLKGIPESFDRVVAKATARKPEDRYATAAEMSLDLAPLIAADNGTRVISIPTADTQVIRRKQPKPGHVKRRLSILAIVLLVLVAGAFFGVPAFARAQVPDVRDLSQVAATHALERAGFRVEPVLVNDPAIAQGHAIATEPPAHARARKGSKIVLSISLGPKIITLPSVVGETEDKAVAQLTALNLHVIKRRAFDANTAKGVVISQSPQADVSVAEGRQITIVISLGVEQVLVPTVAGLKVDEATTALQGAGFIAVVKRQVNDHVAKDLVISSSPSEGVKAPKGSHVNLLVSDGPSKVPVPDVRGMAYQHGAEVIKRAGLNPVRSEVPGSFGDTIISENPPAGSKQKRGTTIVLYTT